jgi:hypothetical protein
MGCEVIPWYTLTDDSTPPFVDLDKGMLTRGPRAAGGRAQGHARP